MTDTVIAQQGDTVDLICRRQYGDESGYVEAVLDATPGLAALGPVLPIGTAIRVPDVNIEPSTPTLVTLWD